MALLIAALCAEGQSIINNVGQIERGYERIDERLNALGACVEARGRPAEVTACARAIPTRRKSRSFASFGIRAFTTTRDAGTFSLAGDDPVGEVMARWTGLQDDLSESARRLVIGRQVHGTTVLTHRGGWEGLAPRRVKPTDTSRRRGESRSRFRSPTAFPFSLRTSRASSRFCIPDGGAPSARIIDAGYRGSRPATAFRPTS